MLSFYNEYIIYEIVIFIFIVLSAFFSGTETALVSANKLKLNSLMERGSTRARRALALLDHIEDALGTTLIGNNIANIAATAFITFIAARAFLLKETGIIIVTFIQATIFLLLCEIMPKIIARSKSESYLMTFSVPVSFFMMVLKPGVKLSLMFSTALKNRLNFKSSDYSITQSKDEIDMLFKLGKKEGVIDKEHHDLVLEILSFHDVTANEVMIPTIDIISIEKKESVKKLARLIDKTRFSRIPVYEDRVDNIIGYVGYRNLLRRKKELSIESMLKKPYYVPETKKIYELFNEMLEKKIHLVFVVNEFGAVEGMLTPEDIAEEIVGEIQTQDHPDENLITKINKNKYLLSGGLDIDFFQRRFSVAIEKRGFETIAGFVTYKLGRIPSKGEELVFEGATYIVEEATEKSVEKILYIPLRQRRTGLT